MKQRSTFVVSESHGTLPENFSLKNDTFIIKALPPSALREDRVTFGVHELPAEIQGVLSSCREVHLKLTSGDIYESIDPYSSRTPAGLHVFLSPEQGASPYANLPLGYVLHTDKDLWAETRFASFLRRSSA